MSNAGWWAAKLNTQPAAPQYRPDPTPPMPPSQRPMAPLPTFQQPTRPAAPERTASCPECGSGNYFGSTDRNMSERCFDCGYPVSQSGSRYGNLTGARVEGGPAKSSLGNDATSNWNPQGIIGRLA